MNSFIFVLLTFVSTIYVTDAALARRFDKFSQFTDLFCNEDSDCEGGCCKKIICMNYLEKGDLCLIKHKIKLGCGCRPGLECAFRNYVFVCIERNEVTSTEVVKQGQKEGENKRELTDEDSDLLERQSEDSELLEKQSEDRKLLKKRDEDGELLEKQDESRKLEENREKSSDLIERRDEEETKLLERLDNDNELLERRDEVSEFLQRRNEEIKLKLLKKSLAELEDFDYEE